MCRPVSDNKTSPADFTTPAMKEPERRIKLIGTARSNDERQPGMQQLTQIDRAKRKLDGLPAGRDTLSIDNTTEPELKRRRTINSHVTRSSDSDSAIQRTPFSAFSGPALLRRWFVDMQSSNAGSLHLQSISQHPIPPDIIRKILGDVDDATQLPALHRVSKALYLSVDSAYPRRRANGLVKDLCKILGIDERVHAASFDDMLSMVNAPGQGYDAELLTPLGGRLRSLGLMMLLHWSGGLAPSDRESRLRTVMAYLRSLDPVDLAMAVRDFAAALSRLPVIPEGLAVWIPAITSHIRSLPESRARADMLRTLVFLVAHAGTGDKLIRCLLDVMAPPLRIELSLYAVVHQSLFAVTTWRGIFGRPLPAQTLPLMGNPAMVVSQLDALPVNDRTTALMEISALLMHQLSGDTETRKYHPYGDHALTPWPAIPSAGICPALEVMRSASMGLVPNDRKEMLTRLTALLALHICLPRTRQVPDAQYEQAIAQGLAVASDDWAAGLSLQQHWQACPEPGVIASFAPRLRSEAYLFRELAKDARLLEDVGAGRAIHQALRQAAMRLPTDPARTLLVSLLETDEKLPEPLNALVLDESLDDPWSEPLDLSF